MFQTINQLPFLQPTTLHSPNASSSDSPDISNISHQAAPSRTLSSEPRPGGRSWGLTSFGSTTFDLHHLLGMLSSFFLNFFELFPLRKPKTLCKFLPGINSGARGGRFPESYPLVNVTVCELENGPVEIVDLPNNNSDFPVRHVSHYQRVYQPYSYIIHRLSID